jgi:hypothetical protein
MVEGDNVIFALSALMLGIAAIVAAMKEPYRKFYNIPQFLFMTGILSQAGRWVEWRTSSTYFEEASYLTCSMMIVTAIALYARRELSEDTER